jgi:hypothetical protein
MSQRARAWVAYVVSALPAYGLAFALYYQDASAWLCVPAAACVWIVVERMALRLLGATGAQR